MRMAVSIFMAAIAAAALSGAAAASGCSGSVSGSPLRQIAKPVVVSLASKTAAAADPDLTAQFAAGMARGGVTVAPEGQGTTILDLSYLVQGRQKGTYHDLTWMKAEGPANQGRNTLDGAKLAVTIYARDAGSRSLVWTGTINCTIRTNDPRVLVADLGTAIGRALGHFVPNDPL